MAVTTSTLYSSSRDAVKSILNSNVSDPKRGVVNSKRRWIYREFPDTTSRDFAGYPIIVLNSPDIGDEVITLNQQFRDDIFTFEIEVYVEFNDKNARVDSLSNSIVSALLSETGQNTLASNGLHNPNITSSPFETVTIDKKKLSARLIRVEFSAELCY